MDNNMTKRAYDEEKRFLRCLELENGIYPVEVDYQKVVVNALGKQVKKKPAKKHKGFAHVRWINVCPECRSPLELKKYCGECGQAIDWGDSE